MITYLQQQINLHLLHSGRRDIITSDCVLMGFDSRSASNSRLAHQKEVNSKR
jgi:hypothetical protein